MTGNTIYIILYIKAYSTAMSSVNITISTKYFITWYKYFGVTLQYPASQIPLPTSLATSPYMCIPMPWPDAYCLHGYAATGYAATGYLATRLLATSLLATGYVATSLHGYLQYL